MSRRAVRRMCDMLLGRLVVLAPAHLRDWAEAVRVEAAAIADDGEALRFAAGAGTGVALTFIRTRLSDAVGLASDRPGPRLLAALAATAAVMIGVVHLHIAGASSSMILVNIASLGVGLALLSGSVAVWRDLPNSVRTIAATIMAGLLVLTNMFGVSLHGVVRWVAVGPLMVQSSLILVPPLLMMFVRKSTATGAGALVVAAGAMAMQPDRAMAGAMVAGMAILWLLYRKWLVALALAASVLGFAATLARADNLPPVRFTESVFSQSWQVHPLLGIAVASGGMLLLLPAAAFGTRDRNSVRQCAVFGAIWLAIILAAVIGNHPTPLVGYGGSAIIGYLLSACLLPPRQRALDRRPPAADKPARTRPENLAHLFAGKAVCA